MRSRFLLPLAVSMALMVGACSGGSDLTSSGPDLDVLAAAPLLELDGTDADALDLSAPVSVLLTSPWCRKCDEQLRDALTVAAGNCDVRMVVVVGRAGEGAIGQFIDANTVASSCPEPPRILTDPSGAAFGSIPVITAPNWLFVADGAAVERGPLTGDEMERRLAP